MSHWSEEYIGLSYSDFDCAQLCIKVNREQFNVNIPIPDYRPKGICNISNMIDNMQDEFAFKIDNPEEGDAVLMIGRGRINHIGVACYINNQLYVLHAMRNAGMTVLHKAISLSAVGLKIEGYYKWK